MLGGHRTRAVVRTSVVVMLLLAVCILSGRVEALEREIEAMRQRFEAHVEFVKKHGAGWGGTILGARPG